MIEVSVITVIELIQWPQYGHRGTRLFRAQNVYIAVANIRGLHADYCNDVLCLDHCLYSFSVSLLQIAWSRYICTSLFQVKVSAIFAFMNKISAKVLNLHNSVSYTCGWVQTLWGTPRIFGAETCQISIIKYADKNTVPFLCKWCQQSTQQWPFAALWWWMCLHSCLACYRQLPLDATGGISYSLAYDAGLSDIQQLVDTQVRATYACTPSESDK